MPLASLPILIRHGETEWNLSGRWQGHANSSLTARGIAQAEALGKRMVDETIDHAVYCSDLERAEHTARLVGGPSGWQPTLRWRVYGSGTLAYWRA